ncbi:MAG: sialate O-acetylesterase [Clostridiales bacterium]|nr:sialate O-acetylesterase [Clostridiales bacterium]
MKKFKVAAVFSSNMVLQRGKNIAIFGEAPDGCAVTAAITCREEGCECDNSAGATADKGRFIIYLPPLSARKNCTVKVSCGEESKTFTNVAIGDVWLLGGQSNMEFELQNCTTGREHLENDKPDVRFYYTQKISYMDDEFFKREENTCWSEFDEKSAACWSAVGYIFGKKLSEETNVTIGLIGCNWGGTSASCWMSREAVMEDEETASYITEYEEPLKDKPVSEQIREYDEYIEYTAEWEKKAAKVYEVNPLIGWDELQELIGKNLWPGPVNCKSPQRPTGLYECMLNRVTPYTLKGFVFYQGESDDHKPNMYYKLFSRLIKQWRDDFGDETLPFLYVQLPGHRYAADPDYRHWCLIREAQAMVEKTVNDTAMAVTIDCGEFNEIHPKDKEPVGERLARLALARVYNLADNAYASAPECTGISFEGGKAIVTVGNTEAVDCIDNKAAGFELSEDGDNYFEAEACIDGNIITLSSNNVSKPAYVRYLWTNYPERVNVYGRNGLPLAPFRSNEGEKVNICGQNKIQQIMEL